MKNLTTFTVSMTRRFGDVRDDYPRAVWMLLLAVIVMWVGRGMVIPFTIIFFTQIVGLKGSVVGGGIAIGTACGIAGVTVTAGLIDRYGGKPILVAAIGTMGAASIALAWAESVIPFLLFTLVLYVASQSYWPSVDSLTASISDAGKVVTSLSLLRVGNAVGIGLGGLIGGVMVTGGGLTEYRIMFLLGGALVSVGAVLVWFLVSAPVAVLDREADGERQSGWMAVIRDRTFMYAMVLLFVLVLGFSQMNMSVPPFLRAEAGASEGFIGSLFFLNTAIIVLLQVPIAARVDRGNAGVLLSVAAVTWAGAFAIMMLTVEQVTAAYLVFAMFTAGELLFMPLSAIFAVRLAPAHLQGRYFSLLSIVWGGSFAVATLTAGWVQDTNQPILLWPVMASIMVAVGIAALRLRRSYRLAHTAPVAVDQSVPSAVPVSSD